MRFVTAILLLCASAGAAFPADHKLLRDLAAEVKVEELRATDVKLVGFGTRHTLSDATSPTRGIGATRTYIKQRFEAISAACGGCLTIEMPFEMLTSDRVPTPTAIYDILAIQKGTSDPNRVIIMAAHVDSRNSNTRDAVGDAPGANDDASGTSAVVEAARILSKRKFPATIVYAVLTGEEQGLLGGKVLANYARAHNWQVEADLNNDIIGNSHGYDGFIDDRHVRVLSEGTRSLETPAEANQRRYNGGELDSPSRNVARFLAGLADAYLKDFQVRMIYRTDRYGRGGDQVPVLAVGYPAVRITEVAENYTRQHQDVRTENGIAYGDVLAGVDYDYLARVTRLNVVALAALAMAPMPPPNLTIEGAVTPDTTLKWSPSAGAASYRVWWRDTTAAFWTQSRDAGNAAQITLKNVSIDNSFFGVSAVSADGYESPVEFPGVAGAFVGPGPKP
jgi:Zn-dependent M28 family amino/carboxypeptidase